MFLFTYLFTDTPTNTQTHRQNRLQHTALQLTSVQCKYVKYLVNGLHRKIESHEFAHWSKSCLQITWHPQRPV